MTFGAGSRLKVERSSSGISWSPKLRQCGNIAPRDAHVHPKASALHSKPSCEMLVCQYQKAMTAARATADDLQPRRQLTYSLRLTSMTASLFQFALLIIDCHPPPNCNLPSASWTARQQSAGMSRSFMVRKALSDGGFDTSIAASGDAAVKLVRQWRQLPFFDYYYPFER